MNSPTIPLTPALLNLQQMREMEQRQIKKHHVAIILLHCSTHSYGLPN
jgi:hypothetical protein